MEKKIEKFTVNLFGNDYTILNVTTRDGSVVGVAPESLHDVINECIDDDMCEDELKRVDNMYGYVLADSDIEAYVSDDDTDTVYEMLADIFDDDDLFNF